VDVVSWADFLTLRKQWREKYRRFPGKRRVEKVDPAVARATFISSSEAAALLADPSYQKFRTAYCGGEHAGASGAARGGTAVEAGGVDAADKRLG